MNCRVKKFLSLCLLLIFTLSLGTNGIAASNAHTLKPFDIYYAEEGVYFQAVYSNLSGSWYVGVFYSPQTNSTEFVAKNLSDQSKVYRNVQNHSDNFASVANINGTAFWEPIIRDNFASLSSAEVIEVKLQEYESTDVVELRRDSVTADLTADLRKRHGSEYHSTPYVDRGVIAPGIDIYVKEDFMYHVNKAGQTSFEATTTLLTIAASIPGTGMKLDLLAEALGIINGVLDYYATVDYYTCQADWARYTEINGTAYTVTNKFVTYTGVNERNNENRAMIVSNGTTEYTHGASYFNDYAQQCRDAYRMYS